MLTNLTKLTGLGIGLNEARKGTVANEAVMLFAAICVLGADVVEAILLRLIEQVFGGGSRR